MVGSPSGILERLRAAARRDLGDFMVFAIRPDERHAETQNEGMQYEGMRFRAECDLAGKIFGRPFGVDVAFGDPILGAPEVIVADDVLGFAGIAPPTLRVYPIETHIAEKLHAYTMPRVRPNSRVKDLPDIALLATAGALEAKRLRAAIEQTFAFRRTHEAPATLPAPTSSWEASYEAIARDNRLRWSSLAEAFEAARTFLDPVLAGSGGKTWEPDFVVTWPDWGPGFERGPRLDAPASADVRKARRLYVMQTKLTLRLDSELIERAKVYAHATGRSVSQLVSDYFSVLASNADVPQSVRVPDIVAALHGSLAASDQGESDYDAYRDAKYGGRS